MRTHVLRGSKEERRTAPAQHVATKRNYDESPGVNEAGFKRRTAAAAATGSRVPIGGGGADVGGRGAAAAP